LERVTIPKAHVNDVTGEFQGEGYVIAKEPGMVRAEDGQEYCYGENDGVDQRIAHTMQDMALGWCRFRGGKTN
jgi:hypothetical protein